MILHKFQCPPPDMISLGFIHIQSVLKFVQQNKTLESNIIIRTKGSRKRYGLILSAFSVLLASSSINFATLYSSCSYVTLIWWTRNHAIEQIESLHSNHRSFYLFIPA